MTRDGQRQAGFTLLEVMVALALTGLVVLLLASLLGLASRSRDRLESAANATAETAAAQMMLRQLLSRALPIMLPNDGMIPVVAWEGRPDRVTLLEPVRPGGAGTVALHRTELAFEEAAGQLNLILRTGPVGQPASSTVLLRGIQAGGLRYFGPPALGQRAAWLGSWLLRDSPPRLLRVEVRFADGDARLWPMFEAALRVRVDGTCEENLLNGECG